MKLQSAIDGATLAFVGACGLSLATIVSARLGWLSEQSALRLLAIGAALIVLGATLGYLRRYSTNLVATLIDRRSNLSDRLASACAFEESLASEAAATLDDRTSAMMRLAIADAAANLDKADSKAAAPFRAPRDSRAAVAFGLLTALVAGIYLQHEPTDPRLQAITPPIAAPTTVVMASGNRLLNPSGAADTAVFFGEGESAVEATIRNLSSTNVEIEVPADLPAGMTTVTIRVGSQLSNALDFEVLAPDDPRATPADHIVLDEEDLEYTKDLVAELRKTAEANEDLELEELAKKLEDVVSQAEKGEITKQQLLEALNKAEEKYMKGSEESVEEAMSDLKQAGKELQKDKQTKELGKALEKGDLESAKKEMHKLAEQIEQGKLSEKQEQKLGQAMEKAAAKMEKAEQRRDEAMQKQVARQEQDIRKLEKKRDEAKNEREREEMVRRLQREKRELKRLQREKQEQEKDPTKRELKQLRRNMKQAAKDLQRKQPKEQRQKSRRQVSKTMKDMARSTGKVSQDQRKMANKAKVATQMGDLKEAMRRAKRKGKQGPKNRFGRNKKNKDFGNRARGQQGQKGAWKPGQQGKMAKNGQGQGKGPGKGQGQQPGGEDYGTGHDPNVMGDPTQKSGDTEDESLQGVRGKGPSTRETILTSAQKGFASRSYKEVYTQYSSSVEEVIKAEKVPRGYSYYVKRYFQKIKPQTK